MKAGKAIRNVLLVLVGLVLVILVALQILLRPQVLTGLVNDFAADYVEGQVNFRQVRAHVIKSFPYLNIDAEDFSITYPHERYAQYDSLYPVQTRRRFSLLKAGHGKDGVDTLAAFRQLSISLNYMALLGRGTVHVHKLELTRPRIFAHYYDSTAANWDILPIGPSDTTEESSPLPPIVVNTVSLTDRPFIVFTNPADTVNGMFTMRRMMLEGSLETEQMYRSEARLAIDSLMISGRLPADTVSLRLQKLRADVLEKHIKLDADAEASLRTAGYGRMRVPIHLDAEADLPEQPAGEMEAIVNSLNLSVSSLNMTGKGRIFKQKDGVLDLDLEAGVKNCPLGKIVRDFQDNIPALKQLPTDAILVSLSATAKGPYGNGQKPLVNASIDKLLIDVWGSRIQGTAQVKDALGEDPLVTLDGSLTARVDSLIQVFAQDLGMTGSGSLDGKISARAKLSQLDMAHIGKASIQCNLEARDLDIQSESDSLSALIPRIALNLETRGNKIDRNIRQGARVLALKAEVDTLDVSMKDMFVRGGKILLLAQNSADILKGGKDLTSMMGILKLGNLRMRDGDGMSVGLKDNTETFRIEPTSQSRPVPKLTLRSKSSRLRARMDANILGLKDFNFDLSASRHIRRVPNVERRNRMLDSLQRVYPNIPRDSLFRKSIQERRARQQQDAFANADINISLSDALRDYIRNWDIEGNIGLESGRAMLPAFPLPTSLSAVQGSFDNDTLDLSNITLHAGESDLSARAHLTGLRRALLGRGRPQLKLKAAVTSDFINANELMRGYAYYTQYQPTDQLADASDEAVQNAIDQVDLPDSTHNADSPLLIIPANLQVDFSLEANGIQYDSLMVSWASADIAMRQRTLQITNALAASNMGDIYFEGFYSTRSPKDIKAGFDLNLVDITAQKVITLFPAVDTLMPLLTTFQGDLDCELAVTTDIDSLMQVVLPSVDGVMKISGKDLTLKQSAELNKIAKLLMFKNKKEAHIDNMSVSGIVQNNILEVFPFVLNVDRYLLAASGTQHLSQEFDYHVSVIKSPLILKFGLNAWGKDFDHIHYGLGKARYRSANVPVFTKQLDTVQYSLLAAIHNIFELGVEKAMGETRTEGYFGEVSEVTAPTETKAETQVSQTALQGMETFLSDVMEQTTQRREALKEEVIRLQAEAANKDKHE